MSTDLLATLMTRRVEIFERLAHVARRQLEIVREGDITVLLEVLARKQQVIGELEMMERSLDPFRGQVPEERIWSDENKRLQCEAAIRYCEEMLKYVIEIDAIAEKELSDQKNRTEQQLKKIDQGTTVHSAYSNDALANSKLDISS